MKFKFLKEKKRIVSVAMALVVGLAVAIPGVGTYAGISEHEVPDGYTASSNGEVAYKKAYYGYNVIGYVNGAWRSSTFNWDEKSVAIPYEGQGMLAKTYPYKDTDGKLSTDVSVEFTDDSKAVRLTYTVKNISTETISNYRFVTYGTMDVAYTPYIANGHANKNEVVNGTAIITNDNEGVGSSFFIYSETENATVVIMQDQTDYGFGFIDPTTAVENLSAGTPGLLIYYPEETLAPNETKSYTVVTSVCEASKVSSIISKLQGRKEVNAIADPKKKVIRGLEANGSYEIKIADDPSAKVYKFTASKKGTIPYSGKDAKGKVYDFSGKKIIIVQKSDSEKLKDSNPFNLEVVVNKTTNEKQSKEDQPKKSTDDSSKKVEKAKSSTAKKADADSNSKVEEDSDGSATTTSTATSPKTGDATNLTLEFVILIAGIAGITGMLVKRRKESSN